MHLRCKINSLGFLFRVVMPPAAASRVESAGLR